MKIIVNSLPKSGTHLLGKLMENLGFREWDGPGLNGALIRETHRDPFKNWKKRKRKSSNKQNGIKIDLDVESNRVDPEWLHNYLNCIPAGSYITGHLPHTSEMSNFLRIHGFKIFHVTRDPRDVLISYINHQRKDKNYPFHNVLKDITTDEAIKVVLQKSSVKGSTSASLTERVEHSLGWLEDYNTFPLSFETLIGDKGGGCLKNQWRAVKEVCQHLELNLTEEKISDVTSKMFDENAQTFNKGTIKQHKYSFTSEQQEIINGELGEYVSKMGYEV